MNVIMMGLELASEELNKPSSSAEEVLESVKEIVNDALSPCCAAVTLLNDLLMMDKVESKKMVLEKESANVVDILLTSCQMFKLQVRVMPLYVHLHGELTIVVFVLKARTKGVELVVDTHDCPDAVAEVDVHKMHMVCRNIVSNAIKFSKSGDVVHVRCSFEQPVAPFGLATGRNSAEGVMRFEVQDEGPGLSQVSAAHLLHRTLDRTHI